MEAIELLKSIKLFGEAPAEDLAAVAAIAEKKIYIAGEFLCRAGDVPDAVFIIESGTIDIALKDKDVPIGSVGAGQALGHLAFFDRRARVASAMAREATHVLRLPFARLDELLAKRPALELAFCRHACGLFARQLFAVAPDLNRRYF